MNDFPPTNSTSASRRKSVLRVAALAALALAGGCQEGPLNLEKGWLDPSELSGRTGGGQDQTLAVQILNKIDPLDEGDPRYVTATAPTAADLQPISTDYLISPNDSLNITITDLQPGIETIKVQRVTQSGFISLPYINTVQAAGRTEFELEQAIAEAYRVNNIVKDAQVSVSVVEARGRAFSILGAVNRPNLYPILQADFRLTDALVSAGDINSPLVTTAYVIRKLDEQRPMHSGTTMPSGGARPTRAATGPASEELAPPGTDLTPANTGAGVPTTAPRGAGTENDVIAPEDASQRVATVDGKQVTISPAVDTQPSSPAGDSATGAMATTTYAGVNPEVAPFEFNAPHEPTNVRVIRIPLDKLRAGQLKYNIAIHPGDTIQVQDLTIGQYFMSGHVVRPGAYNLTGLDVTLKQAVSAAGMLDGVAIPQRTDIVRRIGPDREIFVRVDLAKIFEGREPDVYLKPYDNVVVGTHAIAPFLAAARGAFRLTYGLGFLYDRNYAYDNQNVRF